MYTTNSTIKEKSKFYKNRPKNDGCQFCELGEEEIIEENDDFIILRNKFFYDIFDMCEVSDHLLVIPKKHVDNVAGLTKNERQELIEILARYEEDGYNAFFREPKSIIKTVEHQHTHLLKLGKRVNTINYQKEPYSLEYS